jgi:acyl CoA:acetate/3-ketoacid CoA transferase alpha subunit
MSLVREVVRQDFKELRLAGQGVHDADILLASGSVVALDFTYIGMEVYGVSPIVRRAVESGQVHTVVEWSNAALTWRFKAAAMGVPFLPSKVMLGTDTLKYSSAKVVECPFTGDKVALLPALILDVGIIHVNRADKYGNCQIDGISGFAREMARASKRLIVSAEEIVDTDVIREAPDRTQIPYFLVDAVVEAPYGSHPGEMAGAYVRDEPHIKQYYSDAKDAQKAQDYMEKWIYAVPDHEAYLDLVGRDHLDSLTFGKGV